MFDFTKLQETEEGKERREIVKVTLIMKEGEDCVGESCIAFSDNELNFVCQHVELGIQSGSVKDGEIL